MSKKRSVSELLWLACVYAEQDRHSYSMCDSGPDGTEAQQLAKELHAYRMKRWGESGLEKAIAEAKTHPGFDVIEFATRKKP